ncbi:MAG: V-type ATP synthase subunit D [Oscillospiraceae bacterium]|nr:V-type ATP synthase subunit D [Oscillospiraceae bacterium]
MGKDTLPTKGNLLSVKKTLALAHLGFDLMDRKRNILVREMMGTIDKATAVQSRIDTTFREAYSALREANITLGTCSDLASNVELDNSLSVLWRSVMGVELPRVNSQEIPQSVPYGFAFTNNAFDKAVKSFKKVKILAYEMAELETTVYRLAGAIRKTQKRANALQNIIIPDLTEKENFVTEALEEKEREEFVRLKVLKKRT